MLASGSEQVSRFLASGIDTHAEKAFDLFERAGEHAADENARLLASSHNHFYRALVAARHFAETLDPQYYEEATRNLTIASGQYTNLGLALTAAHARAFKILLDANMLIGRGDREVGPEARSSHYKAAGTLLHQAADEFEQAGQSIRRQEVIELLGKVDTERELATRIASIIGASSGLPMTATFPTVLKGDETAVGTERFDLGGIDTRLTVELRESAADQTIHVQIEVVNIGRRPIRLFKLAEAIPEQTRLVEAPAACRLEGRSLSMDQAKIDPLKTEKVRFVLHPMTEGAVVMKAEIMFLDHNGDILHHPVGPRIIRATPILEYLAKSYHVDETTKNLAPTHCGWRTLTSVVQALKIPRSHVYGARRYNHIYGRQLDSLLKPGLAESRIFPGERGRGGEITKIRINCEDRTAKQYVESLPQRPNEAD